MTGGAVPSQCLVRVRNVRRSIEGQINGRDATSRAPTSVLGSDQTFEQRKGTCFDRSPTSTLQYCTLVRCLEALQVSPYRRSPG